MPSLTKSESQFIDAHWSELDASTQQRITEIANDQPAGRSRDKAKFGLTYACIKSASKPA